MSTLAFCPAGTARPSYTSPDLSAYEGVILALRHSRCAAGSVTSRSSTLTVAVLISLKSSNSNLKVQMVDWKTLYDAVGGWKIMKLLCVVRRNRNRPDGNCCLRREVEPRLAGLISANQILFYVLNNHKRQDFPSISKVSCIDNENSICVAYCGRTDLCAQCRSTDIFLATKHLIWSRQAIIHKSKRIQSCKIRMHLSGTIFRLRYLV
jgi:hypothetical protein